MSKPNLQDPLSWVAQLAHPDSLLALAALALSAGLSWLAVQALRRALGGQDMPILLGRRGLDGVLFPIVLLALVFAASIAVPQLGTGHPVALFDILLPACISLASIRFGVKVLQAAFGAQAPWLRLVERTISWLAWLAVLLWVTGVLPVVLRELDEIRWKIGSQTLSVRTMIEGALTAGAVLLLTLWLSSALESRLLRQASGGDLSMRKVVSNLLRALMLFVGLLLALSAVGIDLTALSVLGGAIGVGLGFGLQKLAANYVSGFVVLAERSMRIGDIVRVDGFEGQVTDIKARYTVIRAGNGRESIVPNEMLITQRVENLTLADPRMALSTTVSVAYDSDVAQVQALLLQACRSQARVLADPAPAAWLSAFGADGLEFTLMFWIGDADKGQQNVRSEVNIAVLQALRGAGIEIPFPQRVVHQPPPQRPEGRH